MLLIYKMGFFDSDGWLSNAAHDVYDVALKPIGESVVSITNRVVNFTGEVGDDVLDFFKKEGDSINDFTDMLSNPFLIIGGLIAAVIILPKVLK